MVAKKKHIDPTAQKIEDAKVQPSLPTLLVGESNIVVYRPSASIKSANIFKKFTEDIILAHLMQWGVLLWKNANMPFTSNYEHTVIKFTCQKC